MPKKLLRRWMPDPHRIRNHRLVSWLGPRLHDPRLLHISREGIARGAAVGGFFGLLIPIGQIPAAAVAAVAWRANLPMAVAGTLITNPFTFAPIYYLAYRIGLFLLGADPLPSDAPDPFAVASPEHATWYKLWYDRVLGAGGPLFIGLFVLACGYATFSYFAISLLWRAYTLRAWRRRAKRNQPSFPPARE